MDTQNFFPPVYLYSKQSGYSEIPGSALPIIDNKLDFQVFIGKCLVEQDEKYFLRQRSRTLQPVVKFSINVV